ncbi:Transposase IS116/IS110/IS902 family protein [Roseovarius marisflavi]|uniref:Transposase IS116/IS110/IS902 family protein n=2 Tax=Roseovarius marisflavi TaxID=1054996 RepID=A0A1M7DGZ6_9RHOB|nr:transposase [Roseovarius marisflavi]SHL78647.1 Transposase IS116/IS110/IS902 family protein [Roseovarius marisflavi]
MPCFAALDVSQETTAICVVDDAGTIIAEKTVVTCPEMITSFLTDAASVGAYLGLTPRRYESGETSRNGRISKQGDKMVRKHLYEAATNLLTRNLRSSSLKTWGMKLAKVSGFKKARIAVARKLAVILHAMWKTNTSFRWDQSAA